MAKLQTYKALSGLLVYFAAEIPTEMAAIGAVDRLEDWLLGRFDPERLEHYDSGILTTVPERVGPLNDEQTVLQLVDVSFIAKGRGNDLDIIQRHLGYGDALVNLVQRDRTLGGHVFGSTAFNPESEMPATGAKDIGITVVRLQIELNLLGG